MVGVRYRITSAAAQYALSSACAPQQNVGVDVGSGSKAQSCRILRMSGFHPIASRKSREEGIPSDVGFYIDSVARAAFAEVAFLAGMVYEQNRHAPSLDHHT
jgi:hypothetical protein